MLGSGDLASGLPSFSRHPSRHPVTCPLAAANRCLPPRRTGAAVRRACHAREVIHAGEMYARHVPVGAEREGEERRPELAVLPVRAERVVVPVLEWTDEVRTERRDERIVLYAH